MWLKRHLFGCHAFSGHCPPVNVLRSVWMPQACQWDRQGRSVFPCALGSAPSRLWCHSEQFDQPPQGQREKWQQQIGNILIRCEHGCDGCLPIKLAMTPSPVELWPRSNDTDVSCMFIAKKLWFLSCVEQSTTKCFHCCVASYLVVKTILFAHCSRKYWMNAKTWDPANSLSIVGFLGLICVQGPLNSSLSPLNANLVSNLYQANVFFCVFCCLLLVKMPLHKALHKSMWSFGALGSITNCSFLPYLSSPLCLQLQGACCQFSDQCCLAGTDVRHQTRKEKC